ncbi:MULTISPECIES: hypothetical protein [Streptomycetaceae]|uniref:Integral membrane protein n=1 Tax=Streptantibioticus cattleyicolor (strain ATCC 35852 / DSM 46488 / JCM 4925 / NBRC 14057 / NRRL 8057) TaxID=1003195 RepID=F8JUF5_STREN|nr:MULTISPECIES: hypothetical protein [Streptomycetaceae]AEW94365.1 integral membrane protein [Streptantibioticus cattleyicolor NRRL 8057 = DSM 46488]MYS59015.1 hypothetical protein [Streptomyces sp. SID5468]CCB74723.1 putative integral membrane protein [Streptantibioticus cattleyicolor NRRL 8057 = DSM 46488]
MAGVLTAAAREGRGEGPGGNGTAGRWRDAAGRWRSLRPGPYAVTATLFFALVTVLAWRNPVISDFGQHASAIERIKADPLHPANPLVDLPGDGSPYYSPLIVALGLLARATGLAGREVLRGWGAVNAAVLAAGVAAFARTLSRRRWTPVAALAAMMLLWGVRPAAWSGFLNPGALTRNLTFPSTFAFGLTLLTWALTARAARARRGFGTHAAIGVLTALILLIHPITSIGAAAGIAALVAGWQHRWDRAALARWAVTVTVAVAVAVLWPYYDVFALAGDTTVDKFHKQLYGRRLLTWYGLGVVGLPALAARWRRHRLDPLVLLFAADVAIAAYGWFSGRYTYGRIFGLLLVPPQFALAVEVTARRPWRTRRTVTAWVAGAAAGVGLVVQLGSIVPLPPLQHLVTWPEYGWAARHIRPGEVVLSNDYRATHVLPAYGAFLVSGAWPDPSLPVAVRNRRAHDVRVYFSRHASAGVQHLVAARYHARWALLDRGQPVPSGGRTVAVSPVTGERLVRLAVPPGR